MRYLVVVTPEAQADLRAIRANMKHANPKAVAKWSIGIRSRIKTLSDHPERCALAPESVHFRTEIREILYGKTNRNIYRVLFAIAARQVIILHVRHGSRLEWEGF